MGYSIIKKVTIPQPYSSEHMEPEHLINMPLDSMSLCPDDFSQWLGRNDTRIKQHIEHLFTIRFQKQFYNLFGESFDSIYLEHYKKRFGAAFLQIFKKNKDAYNTFKSRYLCISDPQFYAPRIIYGMYLQDSFLETLNTLEKLGINITLHPNTEVVDIHKEKKNIRLTFKNDTKENNLVFSSVIIATGHWIKKDPCEKATYFPSWSSKESMRHIDSILQRAVMKAKCQSSIKQPIMVKIAVLGASLSAVDVIKVIFQDGAFTRDSLGNLVFSPPNFHVRDKDGLAHNACIKIDILSRNGLMPKVRGQYGNYKNIHLTQKNIRLYTAHDGGLKLAHVMLLLKRDLENAYTEAGIFKEVHWEKILSPINRGFKQLKKDMKKALHGDSEQGVLIWQTVYHQASELFVEIYKHLPAEDKLNFDLFLSTLHFMHIAPMPQNVAEELIAMHNAKVLETRILGLSYRNRLKRDDDNVEFIDIDGKTLSYDATIVATGQNKNVTDNPTPLFRNIIQRELLTTLRETVTHQNIENSKDRFFKATHHAQETTYDTGQVLRTPDMELIDSHNTVQKGIYIIGVASSTFGTSRASRSLTEGHLVGVTIAKNIMESIKKESPSANDPGLSKGNT